MTAGLFLFAEMVFTRLTVKRQARIRYSAFRLRAKSAKVVIPIAARLVGSGTELAVGTKSTPRKTVLPGAVAIVVNTDAGATVLATVSLMLISEVCSPVVVEF